jgi:hypothetical protein
MVINAKNDAFKYSRYSLDKILKVFNGILTYISSLKHTFFVAIAS